MKKYECCMCGIELTEEEVCCRDEQDYCDACYSNMFWMQK